MIKQKNVDKIVQAIKKVAKDLNIHPSEVKKSDLSDEVSDWSFKQVGGIEKVKKAYFPFNDKDLLATKKLNDTGSYISKLENDLAKKLSVEELLEQSLSKIKPVAIKPYKIKQKKKIKRELNLIISDTHFGSEIKAEETGVLSYGLNEEARRLGFVVKETIEYKIQHREETKLNVLLLGDILDNQLHDPRVGAPLAEQVGRCINLLNQAIAQFSSAFPEVTVYCATGNHGRSTARHHGRATNQKWDSIETMVYFALREAAKAYPNVKFIIPKTPYIVYEVFGEKIFATHGDGVLNVGYPGTGIKTKSIETQINKINASMKDQEENKVFIIGHTHTASTTYLSNGTTLITNGALVPVDEYAVSLGLMESTSGQYLFESVPNYSVGDIRYIRVDSTHDKNEALEQIIKPFKF